MKAIVILLAHLSTLVGVNCLLYLLRRLLLKNHLLGLSLLHLWRKMILNCRLVLVVYNLSHVRSVLQYVGVALHNDFRSL